jgi:hypothetical protein
MNSPPLLLDDAERFLSHTGRLLERLRFEHAYRSDGSDDLAASAARVLSALRPYQNEDGGFGQILEPDFRGPQSQPLCVEQAFRILGELRIADAFSDPMVEGALDFLLRVRASDGGVPNVLLLTRDDPRAPWWQPDPAQPGSLLPTASLLGLLYAHGVDHPWLTDAASFSWRALASLPARLRDARERLPLLQALYETRAALLFLDHAPERARAEQVAGQLGEALHARGLFDGAQSGAGELAQPLDYAYSPTSLARAWFDDGAIAQALAALVASRQADGGFPIGWQVWTPLAGLEWRGVQTVERLKALRAYGVV